MPSKIETWIADKIAEHGVGGGRGRAGIEDLFRARLFLDGRGSQIFGMTTDYGKLEDAPALLRACDAALHSWFEELSRTDPALQTQLYEAAKRRDLRLQLTEPALVRAKSEVSETRDLELAALGAPSEALSDWPSVANGLLRLREVAARVSWHSIANPLALATKRDVARFEWIEDDWAGFAGDALDPSFLPFAGAGGDYLGIYLASDLLEQNIDAPVVYYFHEDDPPFTWVCESVSRAAELLIATTSSRGVEQPAVRERLLAIASGSIGEGAADTLARSAFHERCLRAQEICRTAAQRLWDASHQPHSDA